MSKKIDMTGRVYERLTVIAAAGKTKHGQYMWRCRCECGDETTVPGGDLRTGHTTSCGCAQRGKISAARRVHGQTDMPLHVRWKNMIQRTSDPNSSSYAHYGGRGITVCERWREANGQGFLNFAADMGPTFQLELTLERIDVDGPYSPENCRWATPTEQARNRRSNCLLTFQGQTRPLAEWAELLGLRGRAIWWRIHQGGWPVERALTVGANPPAEEREDQRGKKQ
ncbi:hypothetical protein [Streptomyces sp. NPDC005046]